MSYNDNAMLYNDPVFRERLSAALYQEARAKSGDALADKVMQGQGATMFLPFISSAPGFDAKYAEAGWRGITDGDLLAAVQSEWAHVADVYDLTTP